MNLQQELLDMLNDTFSIRGFTDALKVINRQERLAALSILFFLWALSILLFT